MPYFAQKKGTGVILQKKINKGATGKLSIFAMLYAWK